MTSFIEYYANKSYREYGKLLAKKCKDALSKGEPTVTVSCMDILEYLKDINDLIPESDVYNGFGPGNKFYQSKMYTCWHNMIQDNPIYPNGAIHPVLYLDLHGNYICDNDNELKLDKDVSNMYALYWGESQIFVYGDIVAWRYLNEDMAPIISEFTKNT